MSELPDDWENDPSIPLPVKLFYGRPYPQYPRNHPYNQNTGKMFALALILVAGTVMGISLLARYVSEQYLWLLLPLALWGLWEGRARGG